MINTRPSRRFRAGWAPNWRRRIAAVTTALMLLVADCRGQGDAERLIADRPIEQAVAYLAAEAPRWHAENGCFSCHNNGDGARALFTARRQGFKVPPAAVAEMVAWLRRPAIWQQQSGDQPFKDGKLAAVQFAAAQAAGRQAGADLNQRSRVAAAQQLVALQHNDGSWRLEGGGLIGSPAGYGTTIATVVARKAIAGVSDAAWLRVSIAQADDWIRAQRPVNIPEAAAVLWSVADDSAAAAAACRDHCLELLQQSQSRSGGWGPFVGAAPEPFDTAIAILALSELPENTTVLDMLHRGQAYLVEAQFEDGGWQETTRPAGAESYAQRISTTAWATLALLATREPVESK